MAELESLLMTIVWQQRTSVRDNLSSSFAIPYCDSCTASSSRSPSSSLCSRCSSKLTSMVSRVRFCRNLKFVNKAMFHTTSQEAETKHWPQIFLFTFSSVFVTSIKVSKPLSELYKVSTYQSDKHNITKKLSNQITQYGQNELLRQAKLVTGMQGACSHYIEELFESMRNQMDNVTSNVHRLDMYRCLDCLREEYWIRHNHIHLQLDRTPG